MMVPDARSAVGERELPSVVLTRDLLKLGFTDRAIARMVRSGEWIRVRHGAYANASAWADLDAAGRHRVTARAVLRQARTGVVLSHTSAALEFGAPDWGLDLSNIHVSRTDGKAGRAEAGVRQHSGLIQDGDLVRLGSLQVMSATRAALELTTIAGTEESLCVVNHLLHSGHTSQEGLHQRYESMERWPNSLKTDLVLRLADPRIESVGETRTYFACFREGLPMPQCQFEIKDNAGRVIARVDFAWPEFGVFLEFDGKVKYEKLLRQGERASDVVFREKRREERICRLTGWRCIRVSWEDVENPQRLAAIIRGALFPPAA